jgi:hypothetical protein
LVLASGLNAPWAIVVDSTAVYWTDTRDVGSVNKVPTAGGTPTVIASAQSSPSAIAVNATGVYWTNAPSPDSDAGIEGGVVMTAPLDGGPATILASTQFEFINPLLEYLLGPGQVAVDATNAYWIGAGTVMKAPLSGGTPTTLASGQDFPLAIAVDSTSVYWSNYCACIGGGTITKAPIDGGASEILAIGLSNPSAIAIDESSIYWVDEEPAFGAEELVAENVKKVSLDGGLPITLASGLSPANVAGLVLDATYVYWFDACGSIMRCAKNGCNNQPRVLASGTAVTGIMGMAVDGTSVYWTTMSADASGGTVMKLLVK